MVLAGSVMIMAESKPWWQVAKTPRQGIILAIYFAFGIQLVISGLIPSVHVWILVIGLVWVALSVVILAGALALYRRVRSRGTPQGRGLPSPPPYLPDRHNLGRRH